MKSGSHQIRWRDHLTVINIVMVLVLAFCIAVIGGIVLIGKFGALVESPQGDGVWPLEDLHVLLEEATPELMARVARGETPRWTNVVKVYDRSRVTSIEIVGKDGAKQMVPAPTPAMQLSNEERARLQLFINTQTPYVFWFDVSHLPRDQMRDPVVMFHHIGSNTEIFMDDISEGRVSVGGEIFSFPLHIQHKMPSRIIFRAEPQLKNNPNLAFVDGFSGVHIVNAEPGQITLFKHAFNTRNDAKNYLTIGVLLVFGLTTLVMFLTRMPKHYLDVGWFGFTCIMAAVSLGTYTPIFFKGTDSTLWSWTWKSLALCGLNLSTCMTVYTFFRLQRRMPKDSKAIQPSYLLWLGLMTLVGVTVAHLPIFTGSIGNGSQGMVIQSEFSGALCAIFASIGAVDLWRQHRRHKIDQKDWLNQHINRRLGEALIFTASFTAMFAAYTGGQLNLFESLHIDVWQLWGLVPTSTLFFFLLTFMGRNVRDYSEVRGKLTPLQVHVALKDPALATRAWSVTTFAADVSGFTMLEILNAHCPKIVPDVTNLMRDIHGYFEDVFSSLPEFHVKDVADDHIAIFENPSGSTDQLRTSFNLFCAKVIPQMDVWHKRLESMLDTHNIPNAFKDAMLKKFGLHPIILSAKDLIAHEGYVSSGFGDFRSTRFSVVKGVEKLTSIDMIGMLESDALALGMTRADMGQAPVPPSVNTGDGLSSKLAYFQHSGPVGTYLVVPTKVNDVLGLLGVTPQNVVVVKVDRNFRVLDVEKRPPAELQKGA